MTRLPVLLRARIVLWRIRRLCLLGALALVALGVARAAAPPAPATLPTVVAARDLAAGTVLTASDLRVARVPRALVPSGASGAPGPLVGSEVAVAVPAGLAVVEGLLAGDRFAVDAPDGSVVVPVRLADPAVAAILRPGDRVDLVAGSDAEPTGAPDVVARDALVLESSREAAAGALGVGPEATVLTVVAVGPDDGRRLASLAAWHAVGAVLVG
ncbi:SAF domain-containing protein [Cellulomonas carbonis]|uniref:Flagellar basal body P-ring biosynthesis protein FlgA n=1 Tax=Cellulomonas carbonis T26 TaxID=947969 RepID=A0A0A0BP31_9CELL|nr:SAF domain-containing protein [Cellulomonas carbonis]KGM08839.1 flagellar basal body P-ring biosynthesis protein FlgA [Cellulomonas carbonis T26]GGC16278.1 hypothetical protein GCM10010972_31960 [Cellulomonas carbonis]